MQNKGKLSKTPIEMQNIGKQSTFYTKEKLKNLLQKQITLTLLINNKEKVFEELKSSKYNDFIQRIQKQYFPKLMNQNQLILVQENNAIIQQSITQTIQEVIQNSNIPIKVMRLNDFLLDQANQLNNFQESIKKQSTIKQQYEKILKEYLKQESIIKDQKIYIKKLLDEKSDLIEQISKLKQLVQQQSENTICQQNSVLNEKIVQLNQKYETDTETQNQFEKCEQKQSKDNKIHRKLITPKESSLYKGLTPDKIKMLISQQKNVNQSKHDQSLQVTSTQPTFISQSQKIFTLGKQNITCGFHSHSQQINPLQTFNQFEQDEVETQKQQQHARNSKVDEQQLQTQQHNRKYQAHGSMNIKHQQPNPQTDNISLHDTKQKHEEQKQFQKQYENHQKSNENQIAQILNQQFSSNNPEYNQLQIQKKQNKLTQKQILTLMQGKPIKTQSSSQIELNQQQVQIKTSSKLLIQNSGKQSEQQQEQRKKIIFKKQESSEQQKELEVLQEQNQFTQFDKTNLTQMNLNYRDQLNELALKTSEILRCQIDSNCEFIWIRVGKGENYYCPLCDEWGEELKEQFQECVYCYIQTSSYFLTPCGHAYHEECIKDLVQKADENTKIKCLCTKSIHKALLHQGYLDQPQEKQQN